ncbi:uncharacterized protein C8R40DRAFT_1083529 [Lentinula edodes]|uniref:uncharacterized protein n=1 Tax=Lentinula edodes TaxID=5353 RepID=UPI001E8E87BE|nr:uncharacterized protein C8R40DRAFT_1083529 [Lentinula edodes]KAH7879875.1 hypothetical protein C8R40DRAFT_1083529 [Lentinula edodes]
MSGRFAKRSQPELDLSSFTKLDALILAQSVYELGASSWPTVAKLLSKHPLLRHPKSFFTAQSCETLYKKLRNDASLEITEADNERHSPLNRKLAQIHYQARILELRDLISTEEQKFKKVLSEIEELKNNASKATAPTNGAKMGVEDFTADLSGISSTFSSNKVEPSNDETANLLRSPQHSDIEEVASLARDNSAEARDDNKEGRDEVESLAISHDDTPPLLHVRPLEGDAPQRSVVEVSIDADDEVSRSSQAPTPTAETEHDRMEIDEEGVTSGDEPLQRARRAKAAKRQRKASTPLPMKKGRRLRPPSILDTEMAPEATDNMTEELVQTPGTVDDEASPAPDDVLFKRQGKRRASFSDDNPRELRRLRADSEPIDDEDGLPSSSRRRRQDNQASKRFQNVIGMLHSQISAHRNGTIFHNPIKNSEAPDYHEIVKRPMDLKTIKSRIKDGAISNSLEFQRDIYLMFANAMMYNRPGSDVYNMTEDMMLESEGYIQTFRQTEGFVRGSQR